MGVGVVLSGLDGALPPVKKLLAGLHDRTPMHRQIGVALAAWIDRNFQAQGLEQPWAPLAPSTLFARRQGGRGAKILMNNGMLRASRSFQASADKVIVGFPPNSVAEYHHFGTPKYDIHRHNKMLKFFMPPMGIGPRGARLQRRAAGTPRVGIVSASQARQRSLRKPGGRGDLQSVAFARVVHHPGLKPRPLLPSLGLAESLAAQVIRDYLDGLGG